MSVSRKKILLGSIFALLVSLGLIDLLYASPMKALWLDEAYGIGASIISPSWKSLLLHGTPGQGSPHPLYYLVEKLFLLEMGNAPQENWNLFFFFRITPVFFYALSGGIIFLYGFFSLERFLKESASISQLILIATAFALFYLKVDFAQYYALEARPYSLWLFLSIIHTCFTIEFFIAGIRGKWKIFGYLVCSLLLCTVASPGIFQVIVSLAYLCICHRDIKKAWIIFPALAAAALYLHSVSTWGYAHLSFSFYLGCIREVAFKSFHARNVPVFTLPLPLFFSKIWNLRSNRKFILFIAYLASLFLLSYLLFLMCLWKGFLVAARQYIYLIPVFLPIYFLALQQLCEYIARMSPWKRATPISLLTVWACFICVSSAPEYIKRSWLFSQRLSEAKVYSKSANPACSKPLSGDVCLEADFCKLTKECRNIETVCSPR